MRWGTVAVVLALLAGSGCNQIAGINEPAIVEGPGSSSGSSGTSGTSGGPTVDITQFVGRWVSTNVTDAFTDCPAASTDTNQALAFLLTRGSDATTIISTPERQPTCHIATSVANNVATVLPGQHCSFVLTGETDTYAYVDPTTFTIGTDGSAQLVLHASTTSNTSPPITCNFSQSGTFIKQ